MSKWDIDDHAFLMTCAKRHYYYYYYYYYS